MKSLSGIVAIFILATRLLAQSNAPVRLALIAETDKASAAADVLTARLSGNPQIQLLERNEIEKVYREQGLSAANRNYLKLGQILGADGLLLIDVIRTKQATNLATRLIAVKPGVVLLNEDFPWPLKDMTEWAPEFVNHLNPFLPKLSVLAKEAVPISVVNLRSAVSSAEARETERQLKLLTIQRLSQERQFFVLERQQMQRLGEEKELQVDASAFWGGSYLLEGVVDQNGYSKDMITINVRLTPPKGGVPLPFEISGSRTNFAAVVNQLAAKITGLLQVNTSVPEWKAADEAAQYWKEAQWALRWQIYPEAQMAAESAWALGKKDLDCTVVRIRAYIDTVPRVAAANVDYYAKGKEDTHYVHVNAPPDPQNCDVALYALAAYHDFCRTSPEGEPKILWRGPGWTDWHDSDWYRLGIDALAAAAQVLQHYYFQPEARGPVAGKLSDLRQLARTVAQEIARSPSVRDSYFVGDRIATRDELVHTIQENPNLFRCEVNWGCFWQERPEDGIALYRELMSSPVFCYIHQDFWLRSEIQPRLVAWNEEDQKRLPLVWGDFVQELNTSTNVLWQLEAKALALADAEDEKGMAAAFTNLFDGLFENRDVLVANKVEILYSSWNTDRLIGEKFGNGLVTDTKESLHRLFYSEYVRKFYALDQEYRNKTVPAGRLASVFQQQEQYLKDNQPYDFFEFVKLFATRDYSKAQALEIQPLVAAYKSNLVAQSQSASGIKKNEMKNAIAQVGFLENDLNRILNAPVSPSPSLPKAPPSKPAPVVETSAAAPVFTNASEVVTNVIAVKTFLAIPAERLIELNSSERIEYLYVTQTAHHWFEGKLLLDCEYYAGIQWLDDKGKVQGGRNAGGPAIAILDPTTERWEVIGYPKAGLGTQNNFYHRTVLWHGELFACDGGQIRKYDFPNQRWEAMKISDGNNYELFAVNDHLYAANEDTIFEIIDGGNAMRILASTRRQPPAAVLDTQDLGIPILFAGPGHSLQVVTRSKIFTWTGNDWHEDAEAPPAAARPDIFMDGLLFRRPGGVTASWQNGTWVRRENGTYGALGRQDEIYCLPNEATMVKFWLGPGTRTGTRSFSRPDMNAVAGSRPLWEAPTNLLPNLPAALYQSNLFLLEDAFAAQAVINGRREILQEKVTPGDEYNAALLCFSQGSSLPQKLFLKFDAPGAKTSTWMFPAAKFLFCGLENPFNLAPAGVGSGGNSKAGVWMVPLSEIERSVTAQRQAELARGEQARRAVDQFQKNFLAKYDRNHNGILDPEEKEKAMEDPDYVKFAVNLMRADRERAKDRDTPNDLPRGKTP